MNVYPVLLWIIMSLLLITLLVTVSSLFSKEELTVNCNTQFECGMESMHPNSVPMFMHSYMVAILFLVFDMEFVISLPLINMISFKFHYSFWWTFIMILTLGLLIEIAYGSVNWKE